MTRLRWIVLKNAASNTIRGGAGAIVAFALPAVLTRALDRDEFAAWSLLLQIAAIVTYLNFGIQTAVARFVAQATERRDDAERDGYVSTAFFMLAAAGVVAFAIIGTVAWLIPTLYKQAPLHLLTELREGVLVLTAFSVLALPTSAFAGVFVGLFKNEYPALTVGGSRLVGAGLVVAAVRYTHSLPVMAGLIGSMNLVGGILLYLLARKMLPTMRISLRAVSKRYLRTMISFCAGLSIWQFSMFLVGGLDLIIVGYFRFASVAYYSVGINMVLVIAGLGSAATTALLAPSAAMHARKEYARLGAMVLKTTRYTILLLIVVSFPLFLAGIPILTLWVGAAYARESITILEILLVANIIRVAGAPYSIALVGAGEHVKVIFSPLFEGFTNLIVSLVAGYYLGPIGVAIGTLVGSIGGVGVNIFYNIPRIPEVSLKRSTYMLRGMAQPVFEVFPALAGITLGTSGALHGVVLRCFIVGIGVLLSGFLLKQHRRTGYGVHEQVVSRNV